MLIRNLGTLNANITADTKQLTKDLKKGAKELKGFGNDVPRWVKPASMAMVGIGTAVVAATALSIKHFGDFEKSMKNVQSVSGATAEEFESLKEFAIEMGSKTAFTAKEAGDAMYFLASAGLSVTEQMETTAAVLDLAAATQTDLAESARIVVNTLSGFTLEAEQSRRVADVFAEAISSSQANMSKLGVAMPVVSATMDDMGISLEETVAGLSLLFDKGGRAETAATGLRNAMKRLVEPTKEVSAGLESLGLSADDVNPKTHSLADIVETLGTAGFDTAASIKIFGLENDAMTKLVSTGADALRDFEKSLNGAAGAAETMKDVQLDSLSGQITLLKSAVDGAVISFGSTFATTIGNAATTLTSLVTKFNNLDPTTKSILAWTTAIGGIGIGLIGGLGLLATTIPAVIAGFTALAPILAASAPLLVGFAALVSVGWATHRVLTAIKTPSDDLRTSLAALEIVNDNTSTAADTLRAELVRLKSEGVDTTDLAVKDLNVSADELMDIINDEGGLWNKFTGFVTGAGEGVQVMVDPTTSVNTLLTTLEKKAGETSTKMADLTGTLTDLGDKLPAINTTLKDTDTSTNFLTAPEGPFNEKRVTEIGNITTKFDGMKTAVGDLQQAGMDYTTQEQNDSEIRQELIQDEINAKVAQATSANGVVRALETFGAAEIAINEDLVQSRQDSTAAIVESMTEVDAAGEANKDNLTARQTVLRDLDLLRNSDKVAADQAYILADKEFSEIITQSNADFITGQVSHWAANTAALVTGVGETNDKFNEIRDAWGRLTGDQVSAHTTWLGQFTDFATSNFQKITGWFNDIKSILTNTVDLWNNAAGLINKAMDFIGGEGALPTTSLEGIGSVLTGGSSATGAAGGASGAAGVAGAIAGVAAPLAAVAFSAFVASRALNTFTREVNKGAGLGENVDQQITAALLEAQANAPMGILSEAQATEIVNGIIDNATFIPDPENFLTPQQRQQQLRQAEAAISPNDLLQQIADNTSGANATPSAASTFELIQLLSSLVADQLADDGYINNTTESFNTV